jgi:hypothetical protein
MWPAPSRPSLSADSSEPYSVGDLVNKLAARLLATKFVLSNSERTAIKRIDCRPTISITVVMSELPMKPRTAGRNQLELTARPARHPADGHRGRFERIRRIVSSAALRRLATSAVALLIASQMIIASGQVWAAPASTTAEPDFTRTQDGTFLVTRNTGHIGTAINAAVANCNAAANCRIETSDESAILDTMIVITGSNIHLDASKTRIIAKQGLDTSLLRFSSCTNCSAAVYLDGNRAFQSKSSFCVDVNGGEKNTIHNSILTNCRDFGIYIIESDDAVVRDVYISDTGQAGIAADTGARNNVLGPAISRVIVERAGRNEEGSLSGIHLEGHGSLGLLFTGVSISDVTARNNGGSGISTQDVHGLAISNVHVIGNGKDGVSLTNTRHSVLSNVICIDNDRAAVPGYDNCIALDDAGVHPGSRYTAIVNVVSRDHTGAVIKERGNPDYTIAWNVQSEGDSIIQSIVGANSRVITDPLGETWTRRIDAGGVALDNVGNIQGTPAADLSVYVKAQRSFKLHTADPTVNRTAVERMSVSGGADVSTITWTAAEHSGLRIKSEALGTCSPHSRFRIQAVAGTIGEPDVLYVCMKTAAENYVWRVIQGEATQTPVVFSSGPTPTTSGGDVTVHGPNPGTRTIVSTNIGQDAFGDFTVAMDGGGTVNRTLAHLRGAVTGLAPTTSELQVLVNMGDIVDTAAIFTSTRQLQLPGSGNMSGIMIGGDVQIYSAGNDLASLGTTDGLRIGAYRAPCTAMNEGAIRYLPGTPGVFQGCRRNSAGTGYEWVRLS